MVVSRNSSHLRSARWVTVSSLGAVAFAGVLSFGLARTGLAESAIMAPPPAVMEPVDDGTSTEKAVLAGGCFWGVQGVFQHVNGVKNVVSGYAGGKQSTAHYEIVGTGQTGHAESVEITFDPHLVNFGTLLQVYFSVAHDPTQLNRQGPDVGTQYRSAIFAATPAQEQVAKGYIAQLDKAKIFSGPIVTKVGPLEGFFPAEAYHQDYATRHPTQPYIAFNDLPKIDNLSKLFPALYSAQPKLVADATLSN